MTSPPATVPAVHDGQWRPSSLAQAVALMSEGLLTSTEFLATSGTHATAVPGLLQDPEFLNAVRVATVQLRVTGALARLEAARHAREAVQVAAAIMNDAEMHASQRLSAAGFIAKAAGTDTPPEGATRDRAPFTVVIQFAAREHAITLGGPRPTSATLGTSC